MRVKKYGLLWKQNQFTITGSYWIYDILVVPIFTNKACKANFYWDGPDSPINIFNPSVTNFRTDSPDQTYSSGTNFITFELNAPGTWYVTVNHNIYYLNLLKNITVRVTT